MTIRDLIARARALSAAATPGPWEWKDWGREQILVANHGKRHIILSGAYTRDNATGRLEPANESFPNIAFLTASRALVPALADALEAALRDREPWRTKSEDELHLVVNLRKERDDARAQVATLTTALNGEKTEYVLANINQEMKADIERLNAQVATLIEALRWYGDNKTYNEYTVKEDGVFKSVTPTLKDMGERARAALKAAGVET